MNNQTSYLAREKSTHSNTNTVVWPIAKNMQETIIIRCAKVRGCEIGHATLSRVRTGWELNIIEFRNPPVVEFSPEDI